MGKLVGAIDTFWNINEWVEECDKEGVFLAIIVNPVGERVDGVVVVRGVE